MLRLEGLCYAYPETPLIQDLNLSLEPGQVLAIKGPSGTGKTTLVHLIAGLLPLQSGEIYWNGQPIRGLSEENLAARRLHFLGMVFQHHYLLAELTALENVLVPGYLADQPEAHWGRELLAQVGLKGKEDLRPKALSGGERQRVAVARALYMKPQLLLCDEPTGSLDRKNAERVLALILALTRDLGTSALIASHDEGLVGGMEELRLG
jgi:lipoprotein-releasing system ATP-binding protein